MGETRVDLLRLLEDLRDAYPGPTDETILTEIVANALDSGAGAIAVVTDPAAGTFTLVDDGLGMRRRELARYHDLAISSKTRGQGIGFAGVGIKLALLVSREVVTETRRGAPEDSGTPDSASGAPPMPEVAAPPGPGARDASGEGRGRRPGRYGLSIQFAARPEDVELGRLVDATVWVNEAHPAYRRAVASRSEGYHVALAVALCLGPLAVEPAREHSFITAFLASWGEALERRSRRARRRGRD